MKILDNINERLKDDLIQEIKPQSKLGIAAAYFSIYAYQELKKQLKDIKELKFIFTSPTFSTEKAPKEKREFYIPRLTREKSLYGSEFEIKLRNELTQKAIAKECAEWIKAKAIFKSPKNEIQRNSCLNIESGNSATYQPINGFTTVELGCKKGNGLGNLITKITEPTITKEFWATFNRIWENKEYLQDVTSQVVDSITAAYRENPAQYIYFITLYNIFRESLNDISEDTLPNEAIKFKDSQIWKTLYDFQKEAVLSIIHKLETYNGCILADSVGLGKTFTALAVMKYYNNRNKSILVLCPKKLADNWKTYNAVNRNNPFNGDKLHYDVLFHTDLLRKTGKLGDGRPAEQVYWENYDLIVIDESHNFRNGGQINKNGKENRYSYLLNQVIRPGVKTKVLMLSATPVNNRFIDLKNQLALAYEGDSKLINEKLNTEQSIEAIFSRAQSKFNEWSKYPEEERTTEKLLKMLDLDFFKVLDAVTLARSRKQIQKYYNMAEVGKFPIRNKPISIRSTLTDLQSEELSFNQIYNLLNLLSLSVYNPSKHILPSQMYKYLEGNKNLTRAGREEGLRRLMGINLLKRLESSVESFRLTVERIQKFIEDNIAKINQFEQSRGVQRVADKDDTLKDLDIDDQDIVSSATSSQKEIDLADMDYKTWRRELEADVEVLKRISRLLEPITPEHDSKLQDLIKHVKEKIENPFNGNNKKIIIFTAFADTAQYLYDNLAQRIKNKYGLNTALVMGTGTAKTTLSKYPASSNLNCILSLFSPISKERDVLFPNDKENNIDILIATDCISEGQNLQDCDYLMNYDIHWNPVRIIQRFGRIDRIGSKNAYIQMVNFWPDLTLDDYIKLKSRVENRMRMAVMASTGDDDLINAEEKGDLEYRKKQLERLQTEVVDLEDVQGTISIMDLGLNEFRTDLLEYMKQNPEADLIPHGLHTVLEHTDDCPSGVVYVLRNINPNIHADKKNALHPFYMVYVDMNGQVVHDYLSPKIILDKIRLLCKGKTVPNEALCKVFNAETQDGKNMQLYSKLLSDSIKSIINVKEESDIDSLFTPGGTTALIGNIKGLDDLELICFFVIK